MCCMYGFFWLTPTRCTKWKTPDINNMHMCQCYSFCLSVSLSVCLSLCLSVCLCQENCVYTLSSSRIYSIYIHLINQLQNVSCVDFKYLPLFVLLYDLMHHVLLISRCQYWYNDFSLYTWVWLVLLGFFFVSKYPTIGKFCCVYVQPCPLTPPMTFDFQSQNFQENLRNGWSDWHGMKYETIGHWANYMTLTFSLIHDLDIWFLN